jgi:hypothetical protein
MDLLQPREMEVGAMCGTAPDLPFTQTSKEVSGEDAKAWLREGANTLPREIAGRPFGNGTCTALIYEFESDGSAANEFAPHKCLVLRRHGITYIGDLRRNPYARELAQPTYRQRVVKDKRRREQKPVKIEIEAENA